MKCYISAKWQLKNDVASLQDRLIAEGHAISADWTKRAFERSYNSFEHSAAYSQEELEAILSSDVLIHISDLGGKGKYVDLGIALAANELGQGPRIYAMGSSVSESQFYFNQHITRIITDDYDEGLTRILEHLS